MKNISNQLKSIILVIVLGFIWITFNKSGLLHLIQLNKDKQLLIKEVQALELKEEFLEDNIKKLKEPNLEYIEFLAYTKYKMIHEDEVLYPHDDTIFNTQSATNKD